MVFVYSGDLPDPAVVPDDGAWFRDDGEPIWVEWRAVDDADHPWPLYPAGVADLMAVSRGVGRA